MKKFFKVYTQKEFNAEKFDVYDDNNSIVYAENENEAEENALDYIRSSSLYNEEETEKWISENPVYAVPVEVHEDNFLILADVYIENQKYYSKNIEYSAKVKDFASSFLSHDELYRVLDEADNYEFGEMYGLYDLLENYTEVSRSDYEEFEDWYNEAMSRYATFM